MRIAVKLALVCAAVMTSAACAQDGGKRWATAVATRPANNHKMIYRYTAEFEPNFDQLEFPERVTLDWRYDSDSGLPGKADVLAMDNFEDRLAVRLKSHGELAASLVLVSTGERHRRWTDYVKSSDAFSEDLKSVQAVGEVPVESRADHDPDWAAYKTFVSGVRR